MRSITLDLLAMIGLAVSGYGIFQVYEPAMWIYVGTMLLLFSIFSAKNGSS